MTGITRKDMTKLVVFDFDGTLGDTRANIVKAMQDAMHAEGLPEVSEAAIVSTIGVPLEKGLEMLWPELRGEKRVAFITTYRRIFEEDRKTHIPPLFPNVKETLRSLKEAGLVLTVASSRLSDSLKGFLHDMEIDRYISYVLGADNVTKAKPDPEPVLKTMRELGFRPDETMVVGDMAVDVLMGKRAGARAVAVTWGNAVLSELENSGPDFIIGDMSELKAIVGLDNSILPVAKRHLLLANAIVWGGPGIKVLVTGIQSYLAIWPSKIIIWLALGTVATIAVFNWMFSFFVKKYTRRILAFPEEKKSLFAFLPVKGWIMVIFFMCLGISLKFIPGVPTEFFASFYPGLGTALVVAGATFLAHWVKAAQ